MMELEESRAKINELLTSKAITQADMARQSGVDTAIISQWKKGEYPGDNAVISVKMENWLNQHLRGKAIRLAIPEMKYIETPTARRIIEAIEYVREMYSILAIHGDPGVGKTMACEEYCRTHPNTFMITASPSLNNTLAVYLEIAESMGITGLPNRTVSVLRELKSQFKGKKVTSVVIIDEAQHLPQDTIEALRVDLHEKARVALVLCGNNTSYARLRRDKTSTYFAQLTSRMSKPISIQQPTEYDLAAILDGWGITDDAQRKILGQAISPNMPGHLRIVRKTLEVAFNYARGLQHTELQTEVLKKAWTERMDTGAGRV